MKRANGTNLQISNITSDIPYVYLTLKKPAPNPTFPPLFGMGSNMVFEWDLDSSLYLTMPQNLTIQLADSQNQTHLAAIIPGNATMAHWTHIPTTLMMGYYTVWIHDSRGPKAYPSPGYLVPNARLILGLYTTINGVACPTCYPDSVGSYQKTPIVITFISCLTSVLIISFILA
ncbi:unnamed protein product [Rhizopus stolonifer]